FRGELHQVSRRKLTNRVKLVYEFQHLALLFGAKVVDFLDQFSLNCAHLAIPLIPRVYYPPTLQHEGGLSPPHHTVIAPCPIIDDAALHIVHLPVSYQTRLVARKRGIHALADFLFRTRVIPQVNFRHLPPKLRVNVRITAKYDRLCALTNPATVSLLRVQNAVEIQAYDDAIKGHRYVIPVVQHERIPTDEVKIRPAIFAIQRSVNLQSTGRDVQSEIALCRSLRLLRYKRLPFDFDFFGVYPRLYCELGHVEGFDEWNDGIIILSVKRDYPL